MEKYVFLVGNDLLKCKPQIIKENIDEIYYIKMNNHPLKE